jgi:hypothetical protein
VSVPRQEIAMLLPMVAPGSLQNMLTELVNTPYYCPVADADLYTRYMRNSADHSANVGNMIEALCAQVGLAQTFRHTWSEQIQFAPWWLGYLYTVNVIGIIPGTLYPDKYIVVGGHCDSLNISAYVMPEYITEPAPGADDNGTSVAAILEVIRILLLSGYQPEYSIMFAIWGSEEASLDYGGSHKHVTEAMDSYGDCVFYLNLDMIGYCPDPNEDWGVKFYPYDTDEPDPDEPSPDSYYSRIKDVFETLTSLPVTNAALNSSSSDSYNFWYAGHKVLYLEEKTRTPSYHGPYDTVDTINFEYLAEMTRGILASLIDIAGGVLPVVGQTPKTRYDDGYKAGSSSDEARPLNGAELVIIENRSESEVDEQVRVGHVKDLVPENASFANMKLAGPSGDRTVSVNRGIVTAIE